MEDLVREDRYMGDMVHWRYETWKIWNMEDMVHGVIAHERYGTWNISYMGDIVLV